MILYPENEFVYIDGVSFYGEEMVSYDVTGLYNDFGSSATYKRVQELLNQYGINYETDDV